MSGILLTIIKMSLSASVAALVVMLARLCLRRAPKIFSYVLWAAVLFRMICPFGIPIAVSGFPELTAFSAKTDVNVADPAPEAKEEADYIHDNTLHTGQTYDTQEFSESENSIYPADYPSAQSDIPPAEAAGTASVLNFLAYIWLSGALAMLSYFVWSYWKLSKKLGTAIHIIDNVFESDLIYSALVLGSFRTRIYIPSGLPVRQKRYVVMHEREHIRRRDYLVKYISFIALSLHWFNPVMWLGFSLMVRDMESSCDEAVIGRLTDKGYPREKVTAEYGETLLSLAERNSLPVPAAFADNHVKKRILNIKRCSKMKRTKMICLFIVCAVIIAGCGISPGQSSQESEDSHTAYIEDSYIFTDSADDEDVEMIKFGRIEYRSDSEELELTSDEIITDYSALAQFPMLKKLRINSFGDIEQICALKGLEELDMRSAVVPAYVSNSPDGSHEAGTVTADDIIALSRSLDLHALSFDLPISKGAPDDALISAIKGFKHLDTLELVVSPYENPRIVPDADLSFLADLKNIKALSLWRHAGDLSYLKEMPNLRRLELHDITYTAEDRYLYIRPRIGELTQLEQLTLDNISMLFQFEFLSELKNLRRLEIDLFMAEQFDSLPALDSIEELAIHNSGTLKDISFVTELKGLKRLDIAYVPNIADLSPILRLRGLEYLRLDGSIINRNIAALTELENLEYLSLRDNYITDASSLGALKNLKYLDLRGNIIPKENLPVLPKGARIITDDGTDTEFPAALSVGNISINEYDTSIKLQRGEADSLTMDDIETLNSCKNLINFHIYNASWGDIDTLPSLKNVQTLSLYEYDGSDLSALTKMSSLRSLTLSSCDNIADLSVLSYCPQLKELRVSRCAKAGQIVYSIQDISQLEELSITYIPDIADLAAIGNMPSLRKLSLGSLPNPRNAGALSELRGLEELYINDVYFEDIDFVSSLAGLKAFELHCFDDRITDISPLSGLNDLEYLFLNGVNTSDLSALSGLENLRDLTLSNMDVSDLSPLYGLGRLRRITIGSGSLGYGELDALRRELPDCEIVS